MTWADGQRVDRDEVEPGLAADYPFLSHFIARVSERDETGPNGKQRIRLRIELVSPNNEPLLRQNGEQAIYWSLKEVATALPQVEGFAA